MDESILGGLPSAFMVDVREDKENIFEVIKNTWNKKSDIIFKSVNHETHPLVIEFIGWSKMDNKLMFKVIDGVQPLGDYFVDDCLTFSVAYKLNDSEEVEAEIILENPKLISTRDKNKI